MKNNHLPSKEIERLLELTRYQILDSSVEKAFDEIAKLAAVVCDCEVAMIGFIDKDRFWVKAKTGIEVEQLPREETFCSQTILQNEILEIPDFALYTDIKSRPVSISGKKAIFYAGVPLVTSNGHALGSLCVMDSETKSLTPKNKEILRSLASQIINLLDARNDKIELQAAQKLAKMGSWRFELETGALYWSPETYTIFEVGEETASEDLYGQYHSRIRPDDLQLIEDAISQAVGKGDSYDIEHRLVFDEGKRIKFVQGSGSPVKNSNGKVIALQGICREITEKRVLAEKLKSFIDLSKDLFCLLTPEGEIELFNRDFEDFFIEFEGELKGKKIEDLFTDFAQISLKKAIQDLINKPNEKISYDIDLEHQGKWCRFKWEFVLDPNSGHIFASAQDVTWAYFGALLEKTISEIRAEYIKFRLEPEKFFDFILSKLLEVTSSEYGFIGEIRSNEKTKEEFLKTFAVSNISWDESTRKFYQENAPQGLEFKNLETLFGEVIKTKMPLITNEAPTHQAAAGIPNGHPPLEKFMGIPLTNAGQLIGMIGIANRQYGYDSILYSKLMPLIEVLSEVVYAHQIERELENSQKFNLL